MEIDSHNNVLRVDVLPQDSFECNGSSNLPGPDSTLTDGNLSPTSLRRSTRVSALKAQKKLKSKDGDMVESQQAASVSPRDGTTAEVRSAKDAIATKAVAPAKCKMLKRKLSGGSDLDQYDCKFGIRLDTHGDVYVMSDESEISSLNDEEVADLRERYNTWQKADVSDEVKEQRRIQIRELDILLQHEESKLAMLKKIRANQQQAHLKTMTDNIKRIPSSVGQNTGGNAYKPAVATLPSNHNAKLNGTNSKINKGASSRSANAAAPTSSGLKLTNAQAQQMLNMLLSKTSNTQQAAQFMKMLTPAVVNQLVQLSLQQQQQQQQQKPQQSSSNRQQLSAQRHHQHSHQNAASSSVSQQQHAAALAQQQQQQQQQAAAAAAAAEAKNQAAAKAAAEALAVKVAEVQHNNAQRIATARMQLRRHMEQQLLLLPIPKAPTPELSFIPNANQPDFYTMLGLDLVVQRVRKDKSVFKKWESEPYICEQCSTDFTPAWEAIEDNNGEYHLYCKQCVRQAQKRKVRADHNNLFKCAFSKMKEQEKEFDKQVAAGKFSEPIPTTIPVTNTTSTVSTSTALHSAQNTASSAATLANNVTPNRASSIQQSSNSSGLNTSSHNHHYHQTGSTQSSQQSHHQPHYSQQSQSSASRAAQSSSSGSSTPQRVAAQNLTKKRAPNATTNSNSSSNSSSGNTASLQLMNALRTNPMLSAMISSPIVAQNLLSQMMSGRTPQNATSAAAVAALLQMAQSQSSASTPTHSTSTTSNRHHQHQQTGSSTNSSATATSKGGDTSGSGAINPIWALNTQLNAGALLNNPQLQEHLRQLQQAQATQMYAAQSKSSKK